MSTIKNASSHRRRELALFLGTCAIASAFMFFLFSWIESIGLLLLTGFVSCVAVLVVLAKVTGKWDRAFRCPDCGGAVDDAIPTKGEGGAPILRLCPGCDILWQTGVVVSD